MLANNTLLTVESKAYEIRQFYYASRVLLPPDNKPLHSLYGFISYQPEWDETVVTTHPIPTVSIYAGSIRSANSTLNLVDASTLNDFFVGQIVKSEALPTGTQIEEINEDDYSVTLNNNALYTFIGDFIFEGFLENDNRITLYQDENIQLSREEDYYTKCAAVVDVTNTVGGLTYYRNIKAYDAATKTITVDETFNDAPPIDSLSTVKLIYDNNHPPAPKNTVKYKKDVYKNIIFLKKIGPNSISPVIKRINWANGFVYDYYRDDVDIYAKDAEGNPLYTFYMMNQFYQVFKCLWNNNGGPSTVEPYFVAGNFDDTTNIFYDPDDGYKWKYMFTIPYGKLQQFMDENWIPLPVNDFPDVVTNPESSGGIECINIINIGENYDSSNAIVDVVISGDGFGASAFAEVDTATKTIQNIVVKSPGYGYTEATVSINSDQGSGAEAIPSVSPIGGNANDILSELGCDRLMVTCLFDGSEENKLPSDISIRQLGLLVNPMSNSTYPYIANSESYSTTTDIIVSNGFGYFQDGEIIYQTPNNANIANANFMATCVKYDASPNRLRLTETTGVPVTGGPIYGNSTGTSRTLLQLGASDFVRYSGNIIYMENRESIQRSLDGMELFRVVLKF